MNISAFLKGLIRLLNVSPFVLAWRVDWLPRFMADSDLQFT